MNIFFRYSDIFTGLDFGFFFISTCIIYLLKTGQDFKNHMPKFTKKSTKV